MYKIFYGAGAEAKKSLKKWKEKGLIPVCFADADECKHYTKFTTVEHGLGQEYDILPLEVAIERYPEYEIYITLAIEKYKEIKDYLINWGIPEERIKFPEDVVFKRGCTLLGTNLQLGGTEIGACCEVRPVKRGRMTISEIIDKYKNVCKDLAEDLANERDTPCGNCFRICEDYYLVTPEINSVVFDSDYKSDVHCNAKCPNCSAYVCVPDSERSMGEYRFIDTWHEIVELIQNGSLDENTIYKFFAGEISINPWKDEVLQDIAKYRLRCHFGTNAIVYVPQIHQLLKEGLADIEVSLDSGNPETYYATHGVDTFEKVVANLCKYAEHAKGSVIIKYILFEGINNDDVNADGFVSILKRVRDFGEISAAIAVDLLRTWRGERVNKNSLDLLVKIHREAVSLGCDVLWAEHTFHREDWRYVVNRRVSL